MNKYALDLYATALYLAEQNKPKDALLCALDGAHITADEDLYRKAVDLITVAYKYGESVAMRLATVHWKEVCSLEDRAVKGE